MSNSSPASRSPGNTATTSAAGSFSGGSSSVGGGGGGLGRVLKQLAKPFKAASTTSGSAHSTPQINPTVIGTAQGIDLNDLLNKLSPNNSSGSRIAASELIRSSVEDSSISSIPEIWHHAKEMIDPKNVVECRRAGFRLLNACIANDEQVVGARLIYYKSIISHAKLEEFDLQLTALKTLTNDGRNMEDLVHSGYPFPHLLSSWLRRLANETQDIRIGRKRDVAVPWSTTEENFHGLLDFLKNSLKFNIPAFDTEALCTILRETVGICRKTSQRTDIAKCCDVIDTVMVFGYLPLENLSDILEVLCGIMITVDQQADQAYTTVYNLANSHASYTTINKLCEILEGVNQSEVNSNTMRGAARILMRFMLLSADENEKVFTDLPVSQILKSFINSVNIDSVRHGLEVCTCMVKILETENLRNKVPYEVWESEASPLEALYQLSRSPVLLRRSRQHLKNSQNGSTAKSSSILSNSEDVVGAIIDRLNQAAKLVCQFLDRSQKFDGPHEMLISLLLDLSAYIDEDCALMAIRCFEQDHYCNPLSKNWDVNLDTLVSHFWNDRTWSATVRIKVLELARDVYTISRDVCQKDVINKLIEDIFGDIIHEQDFDALKILLDLFVTIAVECDLESFSKLCDLLSEVFSPDIANVSSPLSMASPTDSERTRLVTRALARVFVLTFRFSPVKAKRTYFYLVLCCQRSTHTDPLAFLEAARLLCRLRVTTSNYVYLTSPNNMDGLAASVGRSKANSTPQGDEMWWYPEELSYLSKDDMEIPSTLLKRGGNSITEVHEIDLSQWLKIILNVITNGAPWEAYSFILAHFAPQLSNIQLFCDCPNDILEFRKVMCGQITGGRIPVTTFPKDINRLDVMVALIRSMSSLIGYNAVAFTKQDTDLIVHSFVHGLSSWEKTAVPCIHGLVVCCYEFPLSIKKFMYEIFARLQTKITTTTSSPHVMEFLLSLSRIPSLTNNFTPVEYKRVFGMAFQYIQHASDLAKKPKTNNTDSEVSPYMSQYLLALAFNVVANWFLTLKLSNRKEMASFITRNLILVNGHGNDIDEQSLATLDLITRFTHSDLDLVMQHTSGQLSKGVESKKWIYGTSIISIDTHLETGNSQLVMRRPTGTTIFNVRPDEKTIPQKLKEKVLLMHENDEDILKAEPGLQLFSPSYMLLQLVTPTHPQASLQPIPLYDDPATARALGSFDRTPVVDFHKVGVMYIAPGQRTEREILSNPTGSRAYRRFLSRLGQLIRLKDNKQIYTGGLDTENDIDGEYAYAWNDKITQVIFHATTLMPNYEHDQAFASKKRHIGNNYVSIFYDESGLPFDFNVVQSQFNFLNIVVSPHTVTFRKSSGMLDEDEEDSEQVHTTNYYRVRAYRRDGVPAVFAACHLKTVSEEALPLFVRNLALIASKFATVWHSEGGYMSNWRYRLLQIQQLEDRTLNQLGQDEEKRRAEEKQRLQNERRTSAAAPIGGSGIGLQLTGVENSDSEVEDAKLPIMKSLEFSSFT